jgi:hypothetical protein
MIGSPRQFLSWTLSKCGFQRAYLSLWSSMETESSIPAPRLDIDAAIIQQAFLTPTINARALAAIIQVFSETNSASISIPAVICYNGINNALCIHVSEFSLSLSGCLMDLSPCFSKQCVNSLQCDACIWMPQWMRPFLCKGNVLDWSLWFPVWQRAFPGHQIQIWHGNME